MASRRASPLAPLSAFRFRLLEPFGTILQMTAKTLEGIRFFYDPLGRLVFRDAAGAEHVDVTPVRGFPISDAQFGLSICDRDGGELLWIERLSELPADVRETLRMDLPSASSCRCS